MTFKIIGIIFILFVLVGLGFYGYQARLSYIARPYYSLIVTKCEKYGVNVSLAVSVTAVESGFDEKALSKKGAVGLMQLMPETAVFMAEKINFENKIDLYNPETNIELGVAYIKYLSDKFLYENVIIRAYNAGEGNVTKWLCNDKYSKDGKNLRSCPFPETEKYYSKVISYKKWYYYACKINKKI